MTTHYMDEANHADRMAIIDHGRVIALDTPDRLRATVGGDIVNLRTSNDDAVIEEIRRRYQIEARTDGGGITFEVPNGEGFIPGLIRDFGPEILSVSLRRPTLDDVFLTLTGREIRQETAPDMIKQMAQMHGRMRMRGR